MVIWAKKSSGLEIPSVFEGWERQKFEENRRGKLKQEPTWNLSIQR